MNETETTAAAPGKANSEYRPALRYYHANPKGSGSAIEFELHPAHGRVTGSVFATIARQKTTGAMNSGEHVFPTFDWQDKACVKLGLPDICEMLQVFRGVQESIADGKGLFHKTAAASTAIKLAHQLEPRPGYLLEIWRRPASGESWSARILFSPTEALGLSLALEQSMGVIAFGLPKVVPRGAIAAGLEAAGGPGDDLRAAL